MLFSDSFNICPDCGQKYLDEEHICSKNKYVLILEKLEEISKMLSEILEKMEKDY